MTSPQLSQSLPTVLVIVAISFVLLVLLRLFINPGKGDLVLLVGVSGSGKTTLFYQLKDGTAHQGTVPSMQPNRDTIALRGVKENVGKAPKSVEVVDVPGHPKARGSAHEFYRRAARIVFLVDAVEFMGQKTDVAEQLFEVLSDENVQKQRPAVLLLCNKTDTGAKAHTSDFVRKRLEKELEALRSTRSSLNEGSTGLNLVKRNEAFTFAGLRSPKVSVGSGSALTGDLHDVLEFLQ